MKKIARITALMLVVVLSLALLASCGISEKTEIGRASCRERV